MRISGCDVLTGAAKATNASPEAEQQSHCQRTPRPWHGDFSSPPSARRRRQQTSVTRYRERTAASAPRAVLRRVRWSSAFAPLRAASRPFAPGTRARGARGSSVRNPEAKARPSYAGGRAPPPQRVGGRRPLCEPRVRPSLARGKGAGPPFAVRTAPERPQRHAPKGHGQRRGDQVPRRGRAPKGHAAGPRPGCRTSAQTWLLGRQEKPPPGAARTEGRTPGATRGLCSPCARGLVPSPRSSP